MTQPFRTTAGGRILRDQPVPFRFNGRSFEGYAGDTLASALLANDVHLVGRSFKYHRPRGVLSAGSEEPNALVTISRGDGCTTPNLRATRVELYPGLRASSQNHFPSLRFDLGALAGLASPLLSAGFYYKTFMWPPSFWTRLYEPAIRAAAGLGRAPQAADPDRYLHHHAHCDVLVIGAGPAGLAAASAASTAGARVILCDEQAEPGGSLLADPSATIDGWAAVDWLAETLGLLAERVTVLPRTTAFGWYPGNLVGLAERVTDHRAAPDPNQPRERLWQVRAAQIVLATGAIQRPLVFPHNDRPGIMLAEAARTYLHRYGVLVGSRVVIATVDDSAYRVAFDLHAAGSAIAGIIDQRSQPAAELVTTARGLGIPLYFGTTIATTEGRRRVHTVRPAGSGQVIPCDTVLMAGGWSPTVHLYSQARGSLRFDATLGAYVPNLATAPIRAAGACAGFLDLADCLESGWHAGGETERQFAVTAPPVGALSAPPPSGPPVATAPHGRAFVDFQNDVTTRDLHVATSEGFHSIEHVKRYTTAGMATDQGKTANLNAAATVASFLRQPLPDAGLPTFRPPYTPVTFGTLAGGSRGMLFEPVRHTPIAAPDVLFEDVGTWKRARCFPHDGEEPAAAVARECTTVRSAVGVLDASTLGKIEVEGPDAAEFLNRLYTIDVLALTPGRCRYALLLGEDGFIRDDGVIARLAPDRFHVTTTTGGAAAVLHHMEDYLQTEFADLRVWLTSTTEHWAVIAVQGPHSADTLAPLIEDVDPAAMPALTVRECRIVGVSARLFRVSFTGEAGFEINVPASVAQFVWDAVLQAGAPFGLVRYGTDAMHVLRAEKGFIIVGQDTDGSVTPDDLGLGWTIGKRKADFVGKRSLLRSDMVRADRKQMVGLLTADPTAVLEEGAQVVATRDAPAESFGHVTSAYHSETLWRTIALALVAGGRSRIGSTMFVSMPGRMVEVTVTKPVFHDQPARRSVASTPVAVLPLPSPSVASPLAALSAASPPAASVGLSALAPTLRLSVRGGIAAAASIGATIGVILGTVPCRAVWSDERAALWLGPDEWLVLAPLAEADFAVRIRAGLGATPASIVDVSHRNVAIQVAGPRAAWCLNAFCALDLDPRAFPPGACTRTLFGKAEVVLWRITDDIFYLDVARSLAPYVWSCLEEARREFLDPPVA
jgi:sarcosine oxidase subunit alpha